MDRGRFPLAQLRGLLRKDQVSLRLGHRAQDSGTLISGHVGDDPIAAAFETYANEVQPPGFLLQALTEHHLHHRTEPGCMTRHLAQSRAHELFEGHHGGDRIAGKPEHEGAAGIEAPEGDRKAGFHPHAPEHPVATQLLEHRTHVIAISHRHAGGAHEHVGAQPRAEAVREVFGRIPGDAQVERISAQLPALGRDRIRVRRHDPAAGHVSVGLDQLVAAGEDRHPGPLMDGDDAAPEGCQHAEMGGTESRARGQHLLALAHILAGVPHVLADLHLDAHANPVADAIGVFLAYDRVRTGRNRRTREDAGRLAGLDLAIDDRSRGHLGHDPERDGARRRRTLQVGGAHGVAIHRRVVRGRKAASRDQGLGQDAPQSLSSGHGFGAQNRSRFEHDSEGFRRGQFRLHPATVPTLTQRG